jgi:uncharacterized protein
MAAFPEHTFSSEQELRDYLGYPADLAAAKAIDHLDKHCRSFIERAPFVTIGTASADAYGDVSPRGDAPGFVQILDEHTLFIPERPGNKRFDTLSNIIANPNVGLLFLIPGFEDCLRVNGQARIVRDDNLLEQSSVDGHTPKIGIRIAVDQAYLHCAKAIRRAHLWDLDSQHDRSELPSLGKMVLEQTAAAGSPPSAETVAEVDSYIEDDYRNSLY